MENVIRENHKIERRRRKQTYTANRTEQARYNIEIEYISRREDIYLLYPLL